LFFEYDKNEEICLGTYLDKKEYLAFITVLSEPVLTIEIGDKSGFDKNLISEILKLENP